MLKKQDVESARRRWREASARARAKRRAAAAEGRRSLLMRKHYVMCKEVMAKGYPL